MRSPAVSGNERDSPAESSLWPRTDPGARQRTYHGYVGLHPTYHQGYQPQLLINKKEPLDSALGTRTDKWYGFSYKWDADQKEARLVE